MLSSRQLQSASSVTKTQAQSSGKQSKIEKFVRRFFVELPAHLVNLIRTLIANIASLFGRILKPVYSVFDQSMDRLTRYYPDLLTSILKHRFILLFSTLLLFILSIVTVRFIGTELIPEMSQGEFFVDILLPIGTPLEETENVISGMVSLANGISGISSVYSVSGTAAQMGFSATELRENLGQLHIQLKNKDNPRNE